jgi:hypothetical protein
MSKDKLFALADEVIGRIFSAVRNVLLARNGHAEQVRYSVANGGEADNICPR